MADLFTKSLRGKPPAGSTPGLVKPRSVSDAKLLEDEDQLQAPAGRSRPTLQPRLAPGSRLGTPPVPSNAARGALASSPATPYATQQGHGQRTPRLGSRALPLHSQESSPALESQASQLDSPRGSVMSLDLEHVGEMYDTEGESVRVFVRVRPHNQEELRLGTEEACVRVQGSRTIACTDTRGTKTYTFDQVLFQSSQEDVYEVVGMPMVDNCMAGYNSSIFAYGQTGAGKTFTMLGDLGAGGQEGRSERRGLAPRVFEYLFEQIGKLQDAEGRDHLSYNCRCSFLEIYNESITDLLNASSTHLHIREDLGRGAFVEGLTEMEVENVDQVLALMRKGAENRHTGETRMNRESSRSHSVFTCVVEKCSRSTQGVTSVICSRLNLIDLAGSERVRSGGMGGSQVQGEHFKEAVNINKSLTTLGRVITELVEAQRSGRKNRHIPYRDSRLTFLLQDSLGGNAKTMIVANVSPSALNASETSSTLAFVTRAKCIRNKATINLDYRGDVAALHAEILRLNTELDNLRKGFTDPAIQEAAELREKLKVEEKAKSELEVKMNALATEAKGFKRERQRLEEQLVHAQRSNGTLTVQVSDLHARTQRFEEAMQAAQQASASGREALEEQADMLSKALDSSRDRIQGLQAQLAGAEAAASSRISSLESQISALTAALERAQEAQAASVTAASQSQAAAEAGQAREAALQEQLVQVQERVKQTEEALSQAQHQVSTKSAELEQALAQGAEAEQKLTHELKALRDLHASQQVSSDQQVAALRADVAAATERCEQLAAQLAAEQACLTEVRVHLAAEQAAHASTKAAHEQEATQHAATKASLQTEQAAHQATQTLLSESRGAHTATQSQLSEERSGRSQAEASLEGERMAHAATKAALDAQRALAEDGARDLATAQSEITRVTAEVAALKAQLGSAEATLTDKEGLTTGLRARVAELEGLVQQGAHKVEELDCLVSELRQALAAAKAEGAAGADEAAALRRRLADQASAHADEIAQLLAAKQAAEAAAGEHSRTVSRLRQELVEAADSAHARASDLEGAAAGLRAERAGLQQTVESQIQEITALKSSVAQLQAHLASSRAAEEGLTSSLGARTRELEGAQAELAACKSALSVSQAESADQRNSLAAAQEQLLHTQHALAQQRATVEDLKTELAQEVEEKLHVQSQLGARSEELARMARVTQEAELQAAAIAREQAAQISTLQKELIKSQEDSVAREYELTTQISRLTCELDSLRKEHAGLSTRLTGSDSELASLKQMLAQQQEALTQAQGLVSERTQELASAKEAAAQQQARSQAAIRELSQELAHYRGARGDLEAQVKSYLVANTRQTKAFQEIRRLIEWATTPPSSGRSSIGQIRMEATPGGDAAMLGPSPSATAATLAGMAASLSQGGAGGGANSIAGIAAELAPSASSALLESATASVSNTPQSSAVKQQQQHQTLGSSASKAHALATLYRLRSSLTALAAPDPDLPTASPDASPRPDVTPTSHTPSGRRYLKQGGAGGMLRGSLSLASPKTGYLGIAAAAGSPRAALLLARATAASASPFASDSTRAGQQRDQGPEGGTDAATPTRSCTPRGEGVTLSRTSALRSSGTRHAARGQASGRSTAEGEEVWKSPREIPDVVCEEDDHRSSRDQAIAMPVAAN